MAQPYGYDPNLPPRRVRFDAISDAFKVLGADLGTWVLGSLVALGGMIVIFVPFWLFMVFGMAGAFASQPRTGNSALPFDGLFIVQFFIIYFVVFFAITICTGLWSAAMMRLALLKIRGVPASISDLFKLDGTAGQVAVFYLLYMLVSSVVIGIVYGVLVGLVILAFKASAPIGITIAVIGYLALLAVALAIQTVVLFAPLMIIDQKLKAYDAAVLSAKTIWPHVLPMFGLYFCATLVGVLGELACGVGLLFTMPIPYIVFAIVYNDFFRPIPLATEYAARTE